MVNLQQKLPALPSEGMTHLIFCRPCYQTILRCLMVIRQCCQYWQLPTCKCHSTQVQNPIIFCGYSAPLFSLPSTFLVTTSCPFHCFLYVQMLSSAVIYLANRPAFPSSVHEYRFVSRLSVNTKLSYCQQKLLLIINQSFVNLLFFLHGHHHVYYKIPDYRRPK